MVALAALNLNDNFARFRDLAAMYSTLFSAAVLFIVAPLNLATGWRVYATLRSRRSNGNAGDASPRGLMAALLRPSSN